MLIEYEFYYNLENMITKPRNFTKIAGRITRIITNNELTLSGYSGKEILHLAQSLQRQQHPMDYVLL